jgi:hypothetical protein
MYGSIRLDVLVVMGIKPLFLGRDAVYFGTQILTFWRNPLPPFSG